MLSRPWLVFAASFLLFVSVVTGWVGVSALSKLGDSYRDSPAATYILFGGAFVCCSIAALIGAVLLALRVRK